MFSSRFPLQPLCPVVSGSALTLHVLSSTVLYSVYPYYISKDYTFCKVFLYSPLLCAAPRCAAPYSAPSAHTGSAPLPLPSPLSPQCPPSSSLPPSTSHRSNGMKSCGQAGGGDADAVSCVASRLLLRRRRRVSRSLHVGSRRAESSRVASRRIGSGTRRTGT